MKEDHELWDSDEAQADYDYYADDDEYVEDEDYYDDLYGEDDY